MEPPPPPEPDVSTGISARLPQTYFDEPQQTSAYQMGTDETPDLGAQFGTEDPAEARRRTLAERSETAFNAGLPYGISPRIDPLFEATMDTPWLQSYTNNSYTEEMPPPEPDPYAEDEAPFFADDFTDFTLEPSYY